MKDRRLYHFFPKRTIADLNASFADKGKLLRGSSLSVLLTALSAIGLELWLFPELSDWYSIGSVSLLQNFNANFPFLALEPIQFNQNFAAENINPSSSIFATSNLLIAVSMLGASLTFESDSFWDHKPALVIYIKEEMSVS